MDQRKDASEFTKAANAKLLEELPFEDQRDFEEATRGLIAPLSTEPVTDKTGRPIWDPSVFAFIEEGSPAPDSVNPSLWRSPNSASRAASSRSSTGSTRCATPTSRT